MLESPPWHLVVVIVLLEKMTSDTSLSLSLSLMPRLETGFCMQLWSLLSVSILKGGFEPFPVLCSDLPPVFINIVSSPCIYYVSSPVHV